MPTLRNLSNRVYEFPAPSATLPFGSARAFSMMSTHIISVEAFSSCKYSATDNIPLVPLAGSRMKQPFSSKES